MLTDISPVDIDTFSKCLYKKGKKCTIKAPSEKVKCVFFKEKKDQKICMIDHFAEKLKEDNL